MGKHLENNVAMLGSEALTAKGGSRLSGFPAPQSFSSGEVILFTNQPDAWLFKNPRDKAISSHLTMLELVI